MYYTNVIFRNIAMVGQQCRALLLPDKWQTLTCYDQIIPYLENLSHNQTKIVQPAKKGWDGMRVNSYKPSDDKSTSNTFQDETNWDLWKIEFVSLIRCLFRDILFKIIATWRHKCFFAIELSEIHKFDLFNAFQVGSTTMKIIYTVWISPYLIQVIMIFGLFNLKNSFIRNSKIIYLKQKWIPIEKSRNLNVILVIC